LRFILDVDFVSGGDLPELLFGQLDVLFFLLVLSRESVESFGCRFGVFRFT
jgi:hypothetical protein